MSAGAAARGTSSPASTSTARKILGAGGELARSAKYDKADEYVTVVTQLWESLPP